MNFFMILAVASLLVTLGILFTGLFSMARGGDFNAKYGNKLMRARVIAQAATLVLFALALLTSGG